VNLNEYLTPEEVQMLGDSDVLWAVTDWSDHLENGLRDRTFLMKRTHAIARLRVHAGNLRHELARRPSAPVRHQYTDRVKRCEAAISALEKRDHG
jgi:hypothetical protein